MMPHAVAVATYVDDVAVVQDPVDEGRGHDLVPQDLAPLLESFGGREHGGCALVTPVDQLEEEQRAGRADGR
jgi:hypothetical protein